jgi:hypothetical protein
MDTAAREGPGKAEGNTRPHFGASRFRKGTAMTEATETPKAEDGDTLAIAPQAPSPDAEHSPAEVREGKNMFAFSTFVHVGPGAETCEGGEDGLCADPLHFHAWCRLPNPYQKETIREKALAAKARRIRMLRDPNCDIFDILEQDMDTMLQGDEETGKRNVVDELVAQKYWENQMQAVEDVKEREEFAHMEEDLERYRALDALSEDDRSEDEFTSLGKHIENFEQAVEEAREEREKPERDALDGRDRFDLVDMIREQRIEVESNEAFMREHQKWTQYIGTMRPRPKDKGLPNERVFGDINHLKDQAAPEVVEALSDAYGELESSKNRGSLLGNS